jgi:hypothetical protein
MVTSSQSNTNTNSGWFSTSGSSGGQKVQSPLEYDPKEVDDMLSRELRQLSFQKRSVIQEEMHGVRDAAVGETPEMIQKALHDLSHELDEVIPDAEKMAYLQARRLSSSYVMDADFRLRFLRSELFDAPKAARKIVGFLDLLREYFGDFALQRPIRITDLGKDAMDVLRAGQTMQMLPFRDRSGRRIYTVVADFGLQYDYDTRVRQVPVSASVSFALFVRLLRTPPWLLSIGQGILIHVLCRVG